MLKESTQHSGGLGDIGVGPARRRRIGTAPFRHGNEAMGNQAPVLRAHELGVGRIVGGHDRLAERHGLGQGQAESFGPVERDIHVAELDEREELGVFEIAIDDPDVVSPDRRRPKTLELNWMTISVDALQDENGAFAGSKGLRECIDHAQGVLALEDAVEVERQTARESLRGCRGPARSRRPVAGGGTGRRNGRTGRSTNGAIAPSCSARSPRSRPASRRSSPFPLEAARLPMPRRRRCNGRPERRHRRGARSAEAHQR